MRAAATVILIALAFARNGSALANPIGTTYPYPYPSSTASAPTTGTITHTAPGTASAAVTVPMADIRMGQLTGMQVSGGYGYNITYRVSGPSDGSLRAGDVLARTTETGRISYAGQTATGSSGTYFYCTFEPCQTLGVGQNVKVNAGPGASLSLGASLPTYSRGHADEYAAAVAPYLAAGSATFTVNSAVQNVKGTLDYWSTNSVFTGGATRFFEPWTTDDAVSGKVNPPLLSYPALDFTAKTNFGFTPTEAAHLSQYDNFNWLVTFTAYCSNYSILQSCDATHNDNALAPSEINRTIGDYDGRAGGNQAQATKGNPLGADNFDLYFDQVKSTNADRAEFFVGDSRNSNGLRFFDQPNLRQAGHVLVYHNDLVGWNESTQSWDNLGASDDSLGFNWRWVQTGNDGTPNCNEKIGITLNCGYATTAGIIDPDQKLGFAQVLNYGAPDPNLFFANIDQVELPPGTGENPPGSGTTVVPETGSLLLLLTMLVTLPAASSAAGRRTRRRGTAVQPA